MFASLLLIAWFLNMIANPAYFAYMGIGDLRWNLRGHVVIAVVNAVLGLALGATVGGMGVVAGFVIALLTGSVMIAVAYQRQYDIRFSELFDRQSLVLGLAGLAGMAVSILLYDRLKTSSSLWLLFVVVLISYSLIVAIPMWMHPARKQVLSWLTDLRRSARG